MTHYRSRPTQSVSTWSTTNDVDASALDLPCCITSKSKFFLGFEDRGRSLTVEMTATQAREGIKQLVSVMSVMGDPFAAHLAEYIDWDQDQPETFTPTTTTTGETR